MDQRDQKWKEKKVGQELHQCHLEGGKLHMAQHKFCTCYNIPLVIFFLGTPDLVKKKSNFTHIVGKQVKIVD
jgi:hypothetical protein